MQPSSLLPTQAKLRKDLVLTYREIQGRPFYLISDPATGEFYRIREVEFFIARQLDGSTSLDVIRERAQKKFEASLEPETLAGFVDKLRSYGLLDPTERDRKL